VLTQASLTPPGGFSLGYYVNRPSGLFATSVVCYVESAGCYPIKIVADSPEGLFT